MYTVKRMTIPGRLLAAAFWVTALAACQTRPEIRTQSAPDLEISRYTTYGYVDKLGTDTAGYTTLTTRYLKEAVDREMQARGYTRSDTPDLLINFNVATKDKIQSSPGPRVGVGYGGWGWRHGYGWGVGLGTYNDIRNVTEGTLTIDLVDRERNQLVWSGSAVGRLTKSALNEPQPAIEQAVDMIFERYPKAPLERAARVN